MTELAPGWFRVENTFIDDGWLAGVKTLAELKVAMILKRYENEGVAWPSITRMAELAGISRGNVSRAIRRLRASGFIPEVEPGGHRVSTRYTLASSVPGATPNQSGSVPGAASVASRAQLGSVPGAALQRLSTTPTTNTSGAENSSLNEKTKDTDRRSRRGELQALGVHGKALDKLSAYRLQPVALRLEYLEQRERPKKNPAGYVVSVIESGAFPQIISLTPQIVARLVNERHIVKIHGDDVTSHAAKWNDKGLWLKNGSDKPAFCIPPNELTPDVFELSDPGELPPLVAGDGREDVHSWKNKPYCPDANGSAR